MYNLVGLSTFTLLCNRSHSSCPEHFHPPKLYLVPVSSPFPFLPVLISTGSVCLLKAVGWIGYILFMHLSVNGHLSFSHLLVIINTAAVNTGVQVPEFSILQCICLGVHLLGHIVILHLTFEELPSCYPQWLSHFTLPPTVHKGFNFFHIFANTLQFLFCW